MELENLGRLNYLDLTIDRNTQLFEFSIYRKETTVNNIIHNDSFHSVHQKHAALCFYVNRLNTIPLTPENYEKELNIIYNIATTRGYPKEVINRINSRFQIRRDPLYVRERPNRLYRSFTFNDFSVNIGNFLRRFDIAPAFKSGNTLGSLLINNRDKIDFMDRSGVYRIQCDDCQAIYIGETGRRLGTRINEHRRHMNSNFFQHLLSTGHKSNNPNNIHLLHQCHKGKRLKLLEDFEIERHKAINGCFLLNEQIDTYIKPLFSYLNQ